MRDGYTPTMEEYMNNAYISFALGPIVLPALYLVGPELSVEMVQHPEYNTLFKLMSTCGRFLNDIRGYEVASIICSTNELHSPVNFYIPA